MAAVPVGGAGGAAAAGAGGAGAGGAGGAAAAGGKIPPERMMPAGSKDRLVEVDLLGSEKHPLSRWADAHFTYYLSRKPVKVMLPGEEAQFLYEPIDANTKKAFVFPPGYILLAKNPVKDGETPTFYIGPSEHAIKFGESTRKSRRARRRATRRRTSNRR